MEPLDARRLIDVLKPGPVGTLTEALQGFGNLVALLFNTASTIDGRKDDFNHGFHAAIGLATEASEVLDIYKKSMYGKKAPFDRMKLVEEVGDVLFYLLAICMAHSIAMTEVMKVVTDKLNKRYAKEES